MVVMEKTMKKKGKRSDIKRSSKRNKTVKKIKQVGGTGSTEILSKFNTWLRSRIKFLKTKSIKDNGTMNNEYRTLQSTINIHYLTKLSRKQEQEKNKLQAIIRKCNGETDIEIIDTLYDGLILNAPRTIEQLNTNVIKIIEQQVELRKQVLKGRPKTAPAIMTEDEEYDSKFNLNGNLVKLWSIA